VAKKSSSNLIWIDLEMTGLDPDHDRIIEIATIVTDSNLEILAEGPVVAIHQSDALLEGMDEWNTSHHTSSGLVDRVRTSDSSRQKPDVWQQYLPGSAFHGTSHEGTRGLLSLPESGCQHA